MKRAPAVLAATVAGVAATLGFQARSHTPATTPAVVATPSPSTSSSSSSSSKGSSGSSKSRTLTGDAVSTRYGPVQLKVTIAGGKITDVQAVQLPSNDPKSN